MRRLWSSVLAMLICAAAQASDTTETSVAIYDRNPTHLWNRLYRAIAVRAEGGTLYGVDNAEPYFEAFDDPKSVVAVLDEFLRQRGETRESGDLPRALLLNDVWAAFDLTTSPALEGPQSAAIRSRLARVIGHLRLPTAAIPQLPDNYAYAVKSGIVMRRRDLLAGAAGGLHAVTVDEVEYQLLHRPEGGPRDSLLRGSVVLSTCRRCHSADGKKQQFNWGLLMGLLESSRSPATP